MGKNDRKKMIIFVSIMSFVVTSIICSFIYIGFQHPPTDLSKLKACKTIPEVVDFLNDVDNNLMFSLDALIRLSDTDKGLIIATWQILYLSDLIQFEDDPTLAAKYKDMKMFSHLYLDTTIKGSNIDSLHIINDTLKSTERYYMSITRKNLIDIYEDSDYVIDKSSKFI